MSDNGKAKVIEAQDTKSSERVAELVITMPGPEAPGFLRRARDGLRFQELLAAGMQNASSEDIDGITGFIADFVTNMPRADAIELIYDLSELEYAQIMGIITGAGASVEGKEVAPDVPLLSKQEQDVG